ncbi:MAG: hypothetical protein RLZZ200_2970 [Pseudomonadota bacterium]|jgi:surface antigen
MRSTLILSALLAGLVAAPTFADPPDWAPAHGRRDKERHGNDRHRGDDDRREVRVYRGYTGDTWNSDYGIASGRCNTDAALAVIGAAGGAVIGNRTASPENRSIATIIGAVVGGIAGKALGDSIDNRDRACMGQAFEMANVGQAVRWRNPDAGVDYIVKPMRDLPRGCREVKLHSERRGQPFTETVTACRVGRGEWNIRR